MMTDPIDDVRRELEAALAVEPAPGFQMRVRSRIAREDRGGPASALWRGILVVAAGPIIALVIMWMSAGSHRVRIGTVTNGSGQLAVRAYDPVRSPSFADPVAPAPGGAPAPFKREASAARRGAAAPPRIERTILAQGNTGALVPDDQRLALIRLLGALRAGRATVPSTVGARFDADGALVAPAPVVITPLRIDSLPVPDPEGELERDQR